MRMPTKAQYRLPILSLIALLSLSFLGACSANVTGPEAPAKSSGIKPSGPNYGYVVVTRDSTVAAVSRLVPLSKPKLSPTTTP